MAKNLAVYGELARQLSECQLEHLLAMTFQNPVATSVSRGLQQGHDHGFKAVTFQT